MDEREYIYEYRFQLEERTGNGIESICTWKVTPFAFIHGGSKEDLWKPKWDGSPRTQTCLQNMETKRKCLRDFSGIDMDICRIDGNTGEVIIWLSEKDSRKAFTILNDAFTKKLKKAEWEYQHLLRTVHAIRLEREVNYYREEQNDLA